MQKLCCVEDLGFYFDVKVTCVKFIVEKDSIMLVYFVLKSFMSLFNTIQLLYFTAVCAISGTHL